MTYEYNLDNFIAVPTTSDQRLFIYNKNNEFVDSIIVDLSHYFVKNNCLVIKITNKNDLMLSFESRTIAQLALEKLDRFRKSIMTLSGELVKPERPTLNTTNLNMWACDIIPGVDFQLISGATVSQVPKSRIEVIVNGSSHVPCGYPDGLYIGCYFTSVEDNGDPLKARVNDGDVQLGDNLYWIGSVAGFDLDSTDMLDYNYLV
jgi:hypothetical protein